MYLVKINFWFALLNHIKIKYLLINFFIKMNSLNDYEILEKLGSGSYGDVMLAKCKSNG